MSEDSLESYYNDIHSLKIWKQDNNYFKIYNSKKPLLFSIEGLGSSQFQMSITFDSQIQIQIQLVNTIWKGIIIRNKMPKFEFQKFNAPWATPNRKSAFPLQLSTHTFLSLPLKIHFPSFPPYLRWEVGHFSPCSYQGPPKILATSPFTFTPKRNPS